MNRRRAARWPPSLAPARRRLARRRRARGGVAARPSPRTPAPNQGGQGRREEEEEGQAGRGARRRCARQLRLRPARRRARVRGAGGRRARPRSRVGGGPARRARYQPSVAKAIMPGPAGTAKNWAAYRARFVEPKRLAAGVQWWQAHAAALADAQQRYGVPPEIVAGIVGVETLLRPHDRQLPRAGRAGHAGLRLPQGPLRPQRLLPQRAARLPRVVRAGRPRRRQPRAARSPAPSAGRSSCPAAC